jgi:hypothetical protein
MTTKLSRSPERFTFQKETYLARKADEGKTPDNDEDVAAMVDYYNILAEDSLNREKDSEWRKNNMEYDLCSTDWMLEKVRSSDSYAQHLYAAMCNNEFQKINLDNTPENVVEVLTDGPPVWSCSWRHAGGVIADMQQQGDYINWYCSGSRDTSPMTIEEYSNLTEEQRLRYEITKNYVSESVVTDEIRADLLKLGWKVIEDDSQPI